jgi:amidophosphoribosyltransferase
VTQPFDFLDDDRPAEECGVIAVSTPDGDDVAQLTFFGLFALQHRGQEAAGIAVSDGQRARLHKDIGLVSQVFTPETLRPLTGYHAIGHTRYSTTGSPGARNAQPFLVETRHGPLAVAHNGNLANAAELRTELLERGYGLTASSDTEVMAMMLASAGGATWEDRLERTMTAWKGAYSLVLLGADRVVGVRDPWGFRPLSVGSLPEGGHALASETAALRTLGCHDIREVQPGEIISIHNGEIHSRQALAPAGRSARCTFEFIYFSRPDSVWDSRNVHEVRQRLGAELAKEHPISADVVIGVPDSSIPAAIGYARAAGLTYNDGLIKNRYIGRTFIEPTAQLRTQGVALKFNVLAENVAGRRVVMVDDSLVRGTTARQLVRLVREAGATEVHLVLTCPPIISACHFGVDMGHEDDLAAARTTLEELQIEVGSDSLHFLSLDGMMRALDRDNGYCNACFTGEYPIDIGRAGGKGRFEGSLA